MGIAQKTEIDITFYKDCRDQININILFLHLENFIKSQKPKCFHQNLSDIYKRIKYISSLGCVFMIVPFVKCQDGFSTEKNTFRSLIEPVKWKNMAGIVKDVHLECSVYEIGKIILFLCLFGTLKSFSNSAKLDYKTTRTMTLVPSIWRTIISETIYQILISPGSHENLKMFRHPLFKSRLNRMDSLISPEDSLKKLRMKRSNPKENEKEHLADSTNLIFVVLGWSGDHPSESIEVFDVITQKWSFYQRQSPFKRAYHGVALFGFKLYIVGGYNGFSCLSTTLCLNLKSRRWSRKSPMTTPRCYVCTLNYRGYIYAFGGHNGVNRVKSCERYDPRRNKWIPISDMMYRRSDASGADLNGRIFVCGGFDGFQFHFTTEMYDPESDEWTLVGNLIHPRSGHSMISYDGKLFVLGGFNGSVRLREVEIYNEESNEWEEYIPMLTGRSNFCCIIFEEEIYIIGGYNGNTTINSVEVFNKKIMNWQSAPSLNIDRSASGACVMSNSANITSCALSEIVPVILTDIEEPSP